MPYYRSKYFHRVEAGAEVVRETCSVGLKVEQQTEYVNRIKELTKPFTYRIPLPERAIRDE